MSRIKGILAIAACAIHMGTSGAAQGHAHHESETPYAGLQSRTIKSLSEADIEELRRGGGWGLALPAELNGKPGPAHLLELKDKLGLSEAQVSAITRLHDEMRKEAKEAGRRLIAAEAALSRAFEGDGLTQEELRELSVTAASARADLRYVHLSRHLVTPALLTSDQIRKYQVLRGYAPDVCDSIPEGHDAALWKKHNGCR